MYLHEIIPLIKRFDSAEDLIESFAEPKLKGQIYESLWNLLFLFKCHPSFSHCTFYTGHFDKKEHSKVFNYEKYLTEDIGAGRGSADIILKNEGTWIVMSCKYFSDDSTKSIDEYEAQNILAYNPYEKCNIYLLVRNKEIVKQMLENSHNQTLKENIKDMFDLRDMEIYYKILRYELSTISFNVSQINQKFCNEKEPLIPRFHQQLIVS